MRSPRDILAGVQENLADWLGRVADDGGVATISRRRIGNFLSPRICSATSGWSTS